MVPAQLFAVPPAVQVPVLLLQNFESLNRSPVQTGGAHRSESFSLAQRKSVSQVSLVHDSLSLQSVARPQHFPDAQQ